MARPRKTQKVAVPVPSPEAKRSKTNSIEFPLAKLPDDILERVFTFVPIKEAIQASTVSTRFKNSWHGNRVLNFRELSLRHNTEELVAIIDGVFRSHTGEQIQSFQLLIDPTEVGESINKWVNICGEKGIKDLDLYFLESGHSLSAESVAKLETPTTLRLVHCGIELPPVLETLRFLNTLTLSQLSLKEKTLEALVEHCKMLRSVELFRCTTISHMRINAGDHRFFKMLKIGLCPDLKTVLIDAPTLRSVFYSGRIPDFKFLTQTHLAEAIVNFEAAGHRAYEPHAFVHRVINDIFNVTVLTVSALVPEGLTARFNGTGYGVPAYQFPNAREVQMFMHGGIFCNPFDIAIFLMRCPNLVRLFVDLNDYPLECGAYWEIHQKPILDKLNINFNMLRVVKLSGFKFLRSEVELVKIILTKAKFLELLILVTPKNGRTKLRMEDAPKFNQLFLSWKASPTAKILLYDHNHDSSNVYPTHSRVWY